MYFRDYFKPTLGVLLLLSAGGLHAFGQGQTVSPVRNASPSTSVKPTTQRLSQLVGLAVKDVDGKSIGVINDVVLDTSKGTVRYAAVSFGGFLGLGDKLFAVPWNSFQCRTDDNGKYYFTLDVSEEMMKTAPGFDQDHWPDFADETWSKDVDQFYGIKPSKDSAKTARRP